MMPAVTAAALETVNAFPIGREILIKHYFEGEAVFDRLKPYYNGTQYRFEVPVGEFDSLRRFLRQHEYDITVVDRPEDYYVVVRQYTEHPEAIFKKSVRQVSSDGFNCFLMKDEEAIASAVAQGATRLSAVSFTISAGTLGHFETAST